MRPVALRALAILLVGISCATLAAQPEPKIDNTTLESFRTSWQQLTAQLNRTDQQKLQFAVIRIAMAGYRSAFDVPNDLGAIHPEMIRDRIDGMTYAEIMKLADKSSVKVETLPPCDSHSRAAGPCVK